MKVVVVVGGVGGARFLLGVKAALGLPPIGPGQSPETGGGTVSAGGCVSFTVMLLVQVPVFPLASATLQVTVVAPLGKKEPEGGAQTGAPTPGQLSLTTGAA